MKRRGAGAGELTVVTLKSAVEVFGIIFVKLELIPVLDMFRDLLSSEPSESDKFNRK